MSPIVKLNLMNCISDHQNASYITMGREFNFYCAWFCPYAQRAWMVLKDLDVEHKYIEALGSETCSTQMFQ